MTKRLGFLCIWIETAIASIARRSPLLIYFLELIFWLLLMGSFVGTLGFLNAVPANLIGDPVPSSWEAVFRNHGEFVHWYLREYHPVAFSFTVLLFLSSVTGMLIVHSAESRVRQSSGGSATVGKVAVLVLTIAMVIITFMVMTHFPGAYVKSADVGGILTER